MSNIFKAVQSKILNYISKFKLVEIRFGGDSEFNKIIKLCKKMYLQ